MTNTQEKIIRTLNQAIKKFNRLESYLIENDLSERCICSKLASYIERELIHSDFSSYSVDVEYNKGYNGKNTESKILNGRRIFPDLIVHKRGYNQQKGYDNLFCVEMKKKSKHYDLTSDKERLRIMTTNERGFCYHAGFMILINKEDCKLEIDERYLNPKIW